jgi:hypothetical protein
LGTPKFPERTGANLRRLKNQKWANPKTQKGSFTYALFMEEATGLILFMAYPPGYVNFGERGEATLRPVWIQIMPPGSKQASTPKLGPFFWCYVREAKPARWRLAS